MQRNVCGVFAIVVVGLMCSSCANGIFAPVAERIGPVVQTNVVGTVVDEKGQPIPGAEVSAHGASTTTNERGIYMFKGLFVPPQRMCVNVHVDGYFPGARAVWPTKNGTTNVPISIQSVASSKSFQSVYGCQIQVGKGMVAIPQNAIAKANGRPYQGSVTAYVSYLNPDDHATFSSLFAGDAQGVRSNGSDVELTSYGVLRVLLQDEFGEPLQLLPPNTATLTYPIPTNLTSAPPSEIPLWYYDATLGMWVEEGKAMLTRGMYEGTVAHFTDWNCDVPNDRLSILEGSVSCSSTTFLSNVEVTIGQLTVVTNEKGAFRKRVPSNIPIPVTVDHALNPSVASSYITVAPLAVNETGVAHVRIEQCPALIRGRVIDSTGAPVDGVVELQVGNDRRLVPTIDGNFDAWVQSGHSSQVVAVAYDASTSSQVGVPPLEPGEQRTIPPIVVNSRSGLSFIDVRMGPYHSGEIAATFNGTTIVTLNNDILRCVDAHTGSTIRSINVVGAALEESYSKLVCSENGNVVLLSGVQRDHVLIDVTSGRQVMTFPQRWYCTMSKDASLVVCVDIADASATIWDTRSQTKVKELALPHVRNCYVLSILPGNKELLLYDTLDELYALWDISTQKLVRTLRLQPGDNVIQMNKEDELIVAGNKLGTEAIREVAFYDMRTLTTMSRIDVSTMQTPSLQIFSANREAKAFITTEDFSYGSIQYEIRSMEDGHLMFVLPRERVSTSYSSFVFCSSGAQLGARMDPCIDENWLRIFTLK